MQLVRYLFSYSIVVVVVVLIASGYYYRETLFPNLFSHAGHMSTSNTTAGKTNMGGMTGTGRNSGMTDMADKSMAASQQMPGHTEAVPAATIPVPAASITEPAVTPEPVTAAEPIVTTEPVTSAEPTVMPEPVASAEPAITSQAPVPQLDQPDVTRPSTQDNSMAAGQVPRTGAATATIRQPPDSGSMPHSEQAVPDHMMTGQTEAPTRPMHAQVAPVSPVPATQPPREESGSALLSAQMQPEDIESRNIEAIMTARRAYWAGDYDASEQAYQQLINLYPNEVELHGEVGNVYYAQGKWAKAAEAYAQVVRLLYSTGQIAQADYMLQIVTSLDKDLGKQLQYERDGTSGSQ